jgi:PEP-CTERM motif-containing protein
MRKLIIGLLAASALATASAASATTNINFDTATGNMGPSHTYSNGGLSVTAYGVNNSLNPLDLYGKHNGGDENGLGIANDPSGDHEIWGYVGGAVLLDVSDLLANSVSEAQFFMGSTTNGESWIVWEYTGAGFVQALTGTDELTWHDLPDWGSYSYYAFTAGGNGQNVLLGGLSLTQAVPEPATWAMMLLGFGAMGVAFRRRRRTTAALPQFA